MGKNNIHKTGIIAGLLYYLLLSTGCTNEVPVPKETAMPLVVKASISQFGDNWVTKAEEDSHASDYDKQSFVDGDQITISKNSETGVTYQKKGTAWLPASGATPITVTGNSESLTASYPIAYTAVLSDQTSYTNLWQSNRLIANATAMGGNKVSFAFAPAACKITIEVVYTESRKPVSATFNGTGVCDGSPNDAVSFLCLSDKNTQSNTHTYTGIIKPADSRTYTISVVSNNGEAEKTGTYSSSKKDFKAGHHYIYKFSSTTDLILENVSVEDFVSGGSGGLDAS